MNERETMACYCCGTDVEITRIDGTIQELDGRGEVSCDNCYDETSGYARAAK